MGEYNSIGPSDDVKLLFSPNNEIVIDKGIERYPSLNTPLFFDNNLE